MYLLLPSSESMEQAYKGKDNMQMNRRKWCERLNSTYVKVKSTVKWKSGI